MMVSPRSFSALQAQREVFGSSSVLQRYLSTRLPAKLPTILKEHLLAPVESDKIFASQWLSDSEIIMGTKCNKLFVRNVDFGKTFEIPTIKGQRELDAKLTNCGIHCVSVNPSGTLLATGAENPCNVAIYSLPSMEPLAVLEHHSDWIFSCTWLSDHMLLSGSRDETLALWDLESLPGPTSTSPTPSPSADLLQPFPVKALPCVDGEVFSYTAPLCSSTKSNGKIRDTLVTSGGSCVSLTSAGVLSLWDCNGLRNLGHIDSKEGESVCLGWEAEHGVLVAGSLEKLSFVDPRAPKPVRSEETLDEGGIRSLSVKGSIITLGGGLGKLTFYDTRAQSFLVLDQETDNCFYHTEQSIHGATFNPMETKGRHAIYTHCYDSTHTRLFTAGGPLQAALSGSYVALWQ